MWIERHNITSMIDINYLFEYLQDLKLNVNEYEEQRQMLLEDIQNKEKRPDFRESIRKVLNYLVASISDNAKQEKVQKFIQNEVWYRISQIRGEQWFFTPKGTVYGA